MTNCKEFALTRKLDYLYNVKILRGGKSTDCLSPWSLPTIGRREKKTWARSSFGSLQETYDPVNVESRSLALTTRPPVLRFSNHPSNHGALWRVYIPTSVQLQNRPVLHVIRECLNGPQLSLLTRRRQTPRGYVQIKQTKGELALKSQNRKKRSVFLAFHRSPDLAQNSNDQPEDRADRCDQVMLTLTPASLYHPLHTYKSLRKRSVHRFAKLTANIRDECHQFAMIT